MIEINSLVTNYYESAIFIIANSEILCSGGNLSTKCARSLNPAGAFSVLNCKLLEVSRLTYILQVINISMMFLR